MLSYLGVLHKQSKHVFILSKYRVTISTQAKKRTQIFYKETVGWSVYHVIVTFFDIFDISHRLPQFWGGDQVFTDSIAPFHCNFISKFHTTFKIDVFGGCEHQKEGSRYTWVLLFLAPF